MYHFLEILRDVNFFQNMLLEDLMGVWTFSEIPTKITGLLPHTGAIKLHLRLTFVGILGNNIVLFQKIFTSLPRRVFWLESGISSFGSYFLSKKVCFLTPPPWISNNPLWGGYRYFLEPQISRCGQLIFIRPNWSKISVFNKIWNVEQSETSRNAQKRHGRKSLN